MMEAKIAEEKQKEDGGRVEEQDEQMKRKVRKTQ